MHKPKYFRNRALVLVITAIDDVAAGKISAEAVLHRLLIDVLQEQDRIIYYFVKRREAVTVQDVSRQFNLTEPNVRVTLNRLISVSLIYTTNAPGEMKPYIYRLKKAVK